MSMIISQACHTHKHHHASHRNTTPQPLSQVICLSNLPKWKKAKWKLAVTILPTTWTSEDKCTYNCKLTWTRWHQVLISPLAHHVTSSLPMACGLLMTLPQHLRWMIGTTTGKMRPGANVEELRRVGGRGQRWLSIPNEQFLLKTLQFENIIKLQRIVGEAEAPATKKYLEMLFTC